MFPDSPFTNCPQIAALISPKETISTQIICKWLCLTPKTTTLRINLLKITIIAAIEIIKNEFNQRYPNKSLNIFTIKEMPEVICIGNLDPISQSMASKYASTENKVYVDRLCAAAVLRGAHIYAPGVLSMSSGSKINDSINIYTELGKIRLKGSKCDETMNRDKDLFVGRGIVQMHRYQLFGSNVKTNGIAVKVTETCSGVPSLGDSFLPIGCGILQNLPSIICGHVLNPQKNEIVLDMCCAPGNKTTHLAELMEDTGKIIALDRSANKIRMMKRKIESLGLKSVQCFAFDSTKAFQMNKQNVELLDEMKPPFRESIFDRILLDAPCSGLGNRPQIEYNCTVEDFLSYPVMQKKLFKTAVKLLKIGGVLVYSTCSISFGENEGVVRWAIDEFPGIKLVAAEPIFGGPGWSDVGLSDEERVLVQRFGPEQDELRLTDDIYRDSIGFFIAKFIKKKYEE